MSYFVFYFEAKADQLPRLGKRELLFLLSFTCIYVVSVRRGFLFLLVLGIGRVILLWHSLDLPYNYLCGSDEEDCQGIYMYHLSRTSWLCALSFPFARDAPYRVWF